jgi:hypothetical protein
MRLSSSVPLGRAFIYFGTRAAQVQVQWRCSGGAGSQKCERGMNAERTAERRQGPQSATRVGAKERGGGCIPPTCGSGGEEEEDVRLTCRLAACGMAGSAPPPHPTATPETQQ